MSSHARQKYSKATNLNSETIDKLSEILIKLENEIDKQGIDPNISDVEAFLKHGYSVRSLIQSYNYYATVSDYSGLSDTTSKIARLIKICDKFHDLHKDANPLIAELISSSNIKVIYRCLNATRSLVTNPALRLMKEIVCYRNGSFVDPFLEQFDLTLKILPQLISPSKTELNNPTKSQSKNSIRYNFINFWISLNSNASPLTRKDLLINNKKIINNWFKNIASHDSLPTISSVIQFFDKYVLEEVTYKKMTKCKIFGDLLLKKFVELYTVTDIREELQKFLLKVSTDYSKGLVFNVDNLWMNSNRSDIDVEAENSNSGVLISVGDRSFKINNKLIYILLTTLKPWSDDLQLDLVSSIMKEVPELLSCYNYYAHHSTGPHDPKLSSYWIGQSLLLTRITQLPIPETFTRLVRTEILKSQNDSIHGFKLLSASKLIDCIIPTQLTRVSLVKSLTSDSQLIRHINTELMIGSLKKLSSLLNLLSFNDNNLFTDLRSELVEIAISQKFPDSSVILGALNDSYKDNNNKLLSANLLIVCKLYLTILNYNITVPFNSGSFDSIDENFKGIDLVILDNSLQLQAGSTNELSSNKSWISKTSTGRSLIVSIIEIPFKLTKKNFELYEILFVKVIEVLSSIIDNDIVFSDYKKDENNVLTSLVYAILYSIDILSSLYEGKENLKSIQNSIFSILDEAFTRCIRSPYKYLDICQEIKKVSNNLLSPLIVAIFEQSVFAKEEVSGVKLWLQILSRYFIILGESDKSIDQLIKKYYNNDKELNGSIILKSGADYEQNIHKSYKLMYSNDVDMEERSYLEMVTSSPISKLKKYIDSRIPTADIDIVGLLVRLRYIVEDEPTSLDSMQELINLCMSKFGNYLIQKLDDLEENEISLRNLNLLRSKYWISNLIDKSTISSLSSSSSSMTNSTAKKLYITGLFNEVFLSIEDTISSHVDYIDKAQPFANYVKSILENLKTLDYVSDNVQLLLGNCLWKIDDSTLLDCLTLKNCPILINKAIKLCLKNSISISYDEFKLFLGVISSDNYDDISSLVINNNVQFKVSSELCMDLAQVIFKDLENEFYSLSVLSQMIHKIKNKDDGDSTFVKLIEFLNEISIKNSDFLLNNDIGFKFLNEIVNLQISSNDNNNKNDDDSNKQTSRLVELVYEKSVENVYNLIENIINDSDSNSEETEIWLNLSLSSISIISKIIGKNNFELINKLLSIDKFNNNSSLVFSSEFVQFISNEFTLTPIEKKEELDQILKPWLNRGILYITKVFAETYEKELPVEFIQFLKSLKDILFNIPIWKNVSRGLLNSQLDVILRHATWVENEDVLAYANWIILSDGSTNNNAKLIDYNKLMNIFINNASNVLNKLPTLENSKTRFNSSLLIYNLFKFDSKKLSNIEFQFKILKFYLGTLRIEDLILKEILKIIESFIASSWVKYVDEWNFQEVNSDGSDFTKLVENSTTNKNLLAVNISKSFINNSIKNFMISSSDIKCPFENNLMKLKDRKRYWNDWESKEQSMRVLLNFEEFKNSYDKSIYDAEFILLLIIENDELFTYDDSITAISSSASNSNSATSSAVTPAIGESNNIIVNIKSCIESDILQYCVINLVNQNETVSLICKRILSVCLLSIEEEMNLVSQLKTIEKEEDKKLIIARLNKHSIGFKERLIFKLYLGNLLNTFNKLENHDNVEMKDKSKAEINDNVENGGIIPLTICMLSHFIPIIKNPEHFLYEKTYRYLLGGPSFRLLDIPLYKSITQNFMTDPHTNSSSSAPPTTLSSLSHSSGESYYKELQWFLNTLYESLTSSLDLKILNRNGILEWLLNLTSIPYLNIRSKLSIMKILFKLQEIPNGTDLLVRSYGLLCFNEINDSKIEWLSLRSKQEARARNRNRGRGRGLNGSQRIGDDGKTASKNDGASDGTVITRNTVVDNYLLLVLQKVAIRSGISSINESHRKRTRNWCDGDIERSIKRVVS
ncbi:hypothetical protein B5S33_g4130 [[Candida] boidinii]|nr:hypothetical protein B5S33_g4130 [[Candida] boidinii]